ncbi:hypothetical protein C8R46DRAFT_1315318 [Mycena filopes]|nr:hypothetical protein C8R46DRAFT_1315318 [Mycena filopes]
MHQPTGTTPIVPTSDATNPLTQNEEDIIQGLLKINAVDVAAHTWEKRIHALVNNRKMPLFNMSKSYGKRPASAIDFGGTPNFDPDPPSTNKRGMKGQTSRSHSNVLEAQNKAAGVTAPTKKPRKQQEKNAKIDDIRACEARLTERIVGSDARMGARFGRLENGLEMLLKGHLGGSAMADTQPPVDADADDDMAVIEDADGDAEQLGSSQMEVEGMVMEGNGQADNDDLEVLDWGTPDDGLDLEGQDSRGGQEDIGGQVDMEVQDDMDIEESSQPRPHLVLLLGLVLGSDTDDGATGHDQPHLNGRGTRRDTVRAPMTGVVARPGSALVPATVAHVVRRLRTIGVETVTWDVATLVTVPEIATTPAVAHGAGLAGMVREGVLVRARIRADLQGTDDRGGLYRRRLGMKLQGNPLSRRQRQAALAVSNKQRSGIALLDKMENTPFKPPLADRIAPTRGHPAAKRKSLAERLSGFASGSGGEVLGQHGNGNEKGDGQGKGKGKGKGREVQHGLGGEERE